MFRVIKSVIFSWPVLASIVAVFVFLILFFYVANHRKEVLDYSIPTDNVKKTKKKK